MKKLTLSFVLLNILIHFTLAQVINVEIKAFLEGPFNGSNMNNDLNNVGIIPLTQPYNSEPWNYSGTESVGTIPNEDIVDWVLIELRETDGDVSTATEETIIATQAGFIINSGSITSTDGISPLQFNLSVNNNLYAVIYHRNHLPVMSAGELVYDNGTYSWDFTIGEGQVYENYNKVIIESENFIYSWGNWTTYSTVGDQVWSRNNDYGINSTPCAEISGYEGGYFENNDWLISPPIDLDSFTDEVLTFQNAKNYTGPDLILKVSNNYNGTGLPNDATWTTIPFNMSTELWEWTSSGEIDLSGFIGPAVYVAFQYTSTITASASWDIDDIKITGTGKIFNELGHKEITPGVWGMISGDGNANFKIDFVDKSNIWSSEAGKAGYFSGDFNINSEVNNIDKNELWNNNYYKNTHIIMPWKCDMPIRDSRDGQKYNTVKIGDQCWMAENLNVGNVISGIDNMTDNGILEKYCYGDSETNCEEYGGLYQWNEVMQYESETAVQGICPQGWHIPTYGEYMTLTNYLNGDSIAGGKMKETGITHWESPNFGATNETGLFAYGTGFRHPSGLFYRLREKGYFETSTKSLFLNCVLGLYDTSKMIIPFISFSNYYGDGVRCIMDNSSTNQSPTRPTNPFPNHGANAQSLNTTLSWTCSDPENDTLNYDIYFGDVNPPPLVSINHTENTYYPGELDYNNTYYWLITAHDNHNNRAENHIWIFNTDTVNVLDGLIAYYPFNGNPNDESGNGNNGSVFGATLTTDRFGNENSAYFFSGNGDYINANFIPSNIFSISIWYNKNQNQNENAGLLSTYSGSFNYDGIYYAMNESNDWIRCDGNSLDSFYSSALNWKHIVIISDGTKVKVYENTIEKLDFFGTTNHSNYLVFGDSRYNERYFTGKIDNIRIYNRVLNEIEIKHLFNEID